MLPKLRLPRGPWTALALLLGAGSLALLAAESYLRLFRPVKFMSADGEQEPDDENPRLSIHRASSVPGLSYGLAPDIETIYQRVSVRINSRGMRGPEPRQLLAGESTRVLALGDSFTFGLRVEEESIWPRRLEGMLAERGLAGAGPVEVLNLGVSGYSTLDEAARLEHEGLAWEPDLVILAYYLNDPEDEPLQPLHAHYDEVRWWQHSQLLCLLKKRQREREIRELGGGDYYQYLHADEHKWARVVSAFERMHRVTQQAGCELLLVIFPLAPEERWNEYPYLNLHRQVAEAGERAGMHVIDLLLPFSTQRPQKLRVSEHDGHPSVQGHELAARTIASYLTAHPELLQRRGTEPGSPSHTSRRASSDGPAASERK